MTTYLYRAVNARPFIDLDDGFEVIPAGEAVFGRQSGYLSRSSAVEAGHASGVEFEIVRSEPVVFLTRAEQLQKQIDDLHAELEEVTSRSSARVSLKDEVEALIESRDRDNESRDDLAGFLNSSSGDVRVARFESGISDVEGVTKIHGDLTHTPILRGRS